MLALEGKAPKKGGKSRGKSPMSMGQLDKMVAGVENIGEDDEDMSDLSDDDESELLGELEVLHVCLSVCVCVSAWKLGVAR